MKLEDIDRAGGLQRQRAVLIRAMEAAASGRLGDFNIWSDDGERFSAFGMIPADFVRQAVIEGCREALVKIDVELRSIGVHISKPILPDDGDAGSWRRTAEMYARAWQRELGGALIPKLHFIDALVLTTQELRRRAEAAGVAKDEAPNPP